MALTTPLFVAAEIHEHICWSVCDEWVSKTKESRPYEVLYHKGSIPPSLPHDITAAFV